MNVNPKIKSNINKKGWKKTVQAKVKAQGIYNHAFFTVVIFSLIFFMLFISPVLAQDIGDYDVERYCQKLSYMTGQMDEKTLETCHEEEYDARDALYAMDIDQTVIDHCMEVTNISQASQLGKSYTLLKVCVDQEIENIARYEAMQRGEEYKPERKKGLFDFSFLK